MPLWALVAAVSSVTEVHYGEIIASISSRSAGPGTRANIDEFTETTSKGIEVIGGAKKGKAIIILNPAEPPMLMRDTVYVLSAKADTVEIEQAIEAMVANVQAYVPGYRLKQRVHESVHVRAICAADVRSVNTAVRAVPPSQYAAYTHV